MIETLFSAEDFTADITDNTDKGKKIYLPRISHIGFAIRSERVTICPYESRLLSMLRSRNTEDAIGESKKDGLRVTFDGRLKLELREGNVHSAKDWRTVLEPVVARYRRQDFPRYFRADAAFANPEVYEFLKAEGYEYVCPSAS